jgi:RHS repeat-associated protein
MTRRFSLRPLNRYSIALWLFGLALTGLMIWQTPLPFTAAQTCTFAISPGTLNFDAGGGSGGILVTASQPTCAWSATPNIPWVSITAGANGNGTSTVVFAVAFNPTATSRTGTLTVAGQTFTVNQAAGLVGLQYFPLPRPVRLMDTRAGQGNCDSVSAPINAGTSLTVQGRGTCEALTIPANAQALAGNVTVINPNAQAGYLTLYPNGVSVPLAANIVYSPGQILSNAFTVSLSAAGEFNIFAERTIDAAVDVGGYYAPPGSGLFYHPLSRPVRLMDTRAGQGNCDSVGAPINASTSLTVQGRGTCESLTIPANAQALAGNVTVINPNPQAGYLTLYPNGVSAPLAANMVYSPGQILSNAFTVSLSAAGEFNIFAERTIDAAVDIGGYFSPDAVDVNGPGLLFTPLARPVRLLDTRANQGNCDSVGAPINAGTSLTVQGRGTCEALTIPANAQALVGNVTVINPNPQAGYLTLYPNGVSAPLAANMVYSPGQILSNAFTVSLSAAGEFNIFAERTIDAAVDIGGYFTPPPVNQAPVVVAGADQTIVPSTMGFLIGSATDDGLPSGTLTVNWSKVSGPGTVTFTQPTLVATSASFSVEGVYVLRLTANDGALTASDDVQVTVNGALAVNAGSDQVVTLPNTATLTGTVTGGTPPVTIAWSKLSGPGSVLFSNASATMTTAIFAVNGTYVLRLSATDANGTLTDDVQVIVNADPTPPPPNPNLSAPPLDMTVATTIGVATEFLYTGGNPIQTGVAPGTINPMRAAVLKGRVLDKSNAPLPLVKVTVLDHPEFGQTLSRADGRFDMAVNGGGVLTLTYEKVGFLSLQRVVDVPWQDYEGVPDVVMMGYDPAVTFIDLNSATPIQVAQSTVNTDTSGTRRTTFFFKQGTTALMKLPGGAMAGLDKLHVRATEFTVGANGPNAMPGDLPATSAYTYAAAYTFDEAVAANAIETTFSQPVIQYNENFLNLPVGTNVPSGAYDKQQGIWLPSSNGRVVKILTVTSGTANLDVNGNGSPATDPEYAALGINTAERQQLATSFSVNQSLWRVPVIHFSSWDSNFGFGPPSGSGSPNGGSASSGGGGPAGSGGPNGSNECPACILGVEDQRLSEEVDVVGTRFFLRYDSTRPRGNINNYTVRIPLSGATLIGPIKRIELTVSIAGQTLTSTFPAQANQITSFTWDGKDAYGRDAQGQQEATIDIGNVYDGVYQNVANFGYNGNGVPITANTRQEVMLHRRQRLMLGTFSAPPQSLGGWTLSEHHAYDPVGQKLYEGNGKQRGIQTVSNVINTFAGGLKGFAGDGGPVSAARFNTPYGIGFGPDGSIYVADSGNQRIRKIAPDGIITTFAGDGGGCNPFNFPCGEGGPATSASLGGVIRVAVARDGSVYIGGGRNLWRVTTDGIFRRVAGIISSGFSGDGGLARDAAISDATRFALAADGSVYLSDILNQRIRRIDPNGIITTIAGTGATGFSGDGGPASQAQLNYPGDIVAAPNGNVYFVDQDNNRIRRIAPDGIISTYAGTGVFGVSPDGLPALQTDFVFRASNQVEASSLALGPDDSLYVASYANFTGGRIRRIGPDGIVTGIAGNGQPAATPGEGNPALAGSMRLVALGLAPDGSIYQTGGSTFDFDECRIWKISPPLPGFTASQIAIPSEDGTQLFRFDAAGRHLNTVNTLTGATVFTFAYDSAGRLTTVTDGDNNITTIQRNGSGAPTGILSPYNQLTTFTLNADGYLATITNPNSEQYQFAYSLGNASGRMLTARDPRNNQNQFTYDANGRLTRDDDPATGFQTLTRAGQDSDFTVTRNTALNRQTGFRVQTLGNLDRNRINTLPDGTTETLLERTSGLNTLTAPDGTITNEQIGGDPRWKLQAPLTTNTTIATPGALNYAATFARAVTLATPGDPLSLATQTDTLTINGRTSTSAFTASNRTFTDSTPQGRQTTRVIDAQGRLTSVQLATLNPLAATYDTRGRLATSVFGTGVDARTSTLAYNAAGFLSSFTDALARVTGFSYDNAGRVTQQTLPDTRVIGFGYDANGNLTSLVPPGRPAHTFTYTAVDLVQSYSAPGNVTTTFTYNLDRDLTNITRPDALQLNFAYESAGRLQTLTVPNGNYAYGYSATTGRLMSITAPGGGVLAYQYDGFLPARQTWTGAVAGNVAQAFDNNFRVVSQSVNNTNTINFTYDNDDLLTAAGALTFTRQAQTGLISGTALSNVSDTRTYNGFAELTGYNAQFNTTTLYDAQLTYDKLGRITQKVELIGGVTTTKVYGYDTAGRLQTVTRNGVLIDTYSYDSNDNRASLNRSSVVTNGTYDNQDRLTQYGAATYGYTANGELQSKTVGANVTQYGYDVLGNLRTVTLPGGTQLAYEIDGQNRRIGKRAGGTLVQGFLYQDQLEPVAELDGANNLVSRFVYGSRSNVPDFMVKGGATYRLIVDQVGSVRLVVDAATGTIAQRMDYDEFGVVTLDTNPGFQPFGFAGGLYDSQTGLTRFGARDYDAETGRWTAKDPAIFGGSHTNVYAYALNEPVNLFDPGGTDPISTALIQQILRDRGIETDLADLSAEGAIRMLKNKITETINKKKLLEKERNRLKRKKCLTKKERAVLNSLNAQIAQLQQQIADLQAGVNNIEAIKNFYDRSLNPFDPRSPIRRGVESLGQAFEGGGLKSYID